MSYCRFSDLDYQSDVYCYLSFDNIYYIHIASTRPKFRREPPPLIPWGVDDYFDRFSARMLGVDDLLKDAIAEEIGLPYDGKTFSYSNPRDAMRRLEKLKSIGYIVPEWAIQDLMSESEELEDEED